MRPDRTRALGRARAALALGTAAVLLLPTSSGNAAEACAGRTSVRSGVFGTWTTYKAPTFASQPKQAVATAVDPLDGRRWWATNGLSLLRSTDGGCSWTEAFALPTTPTQDVPANRETDRIRAVTVPPTAAGHESVLVAVEVNGEYGGVLGTDPDGQEAGPGTATVILSGADTFKALAPLAAPLGSPGPLVVGPADGTIYATAGGVVQASGDGGRTWRVASPASADGAVAAATNPLWQDAVPHVTRIAVDPAGSRTLWVRAAGSIFRSADGGASYAEVLPAPESASFPVLVASRWRGHPRVVVGEQPNAQSPLRSLRVAEDGKKFVTRRTTPNDLGLVTGSATSLAAADGGGLVLTTVAPGGAGSQVYVYVEQVRRLVAVDEFRLGPLGDVQRTRLGGESFVFRAPGRLVVWRPPAAGLRIRLAAPPPLPPLPEIQVDRNARLRPLSAASRVVGPGTVRVGLDQTVDVPLTLRLAPEPTPLDVFFLLDTSGSMGDVIDGLATDFAAVSRGLRAAGIDAQFGLGDYQDTGGVRYRRLVDISPPGDALRRALNSIRTDGGSEPAYTALHQMSTGTGIRNPRDGQPVARGLHASWRPGSLRVVVHATDEVPSADPDGATLGQAVDAMFADGTRHIGIEVVRDAVRQISDSNAVPDGELNDILKTLSRETGGIAPDEGIDCDADGDLDVKPGAPLVCELIPIEGRSRLELLEPLRRLLATLVDLQPTTIAVGPARAAADVRAGLAEPVTEVVDVKLAHVLEHKLRVTCPRALAGEARVLSLRPRVGPRVGRVTPLRVVCDPAVVVAPARPAPEAYVAALPPAVVIAKPALPPPAPAVQPAPAPAPAQAPALANAPAPAVAPNPGVMLALTPAEEQLQLAFVEQEADGEVELAMSRREPVDVMALRLLAMAVVCGTATAVAVRRRHAVVVQRAD